MALTLIFSSKTCLFVAAVPLLPSGMRRSNLPGGRKLLGEQWNYGKMMGTWWGNDGKTCVSHHFPVIFHSSIFYGNIGGWCLPCLPRQPNQPSPNHRHWHWLHHRAEIHFVQGDPLAKKNSETDAATPQAHWSSSEIPPFCATIWGDFKWFLTFGEAQRGIFVGLKTHEY